MDESKEGGGEKTASAGVSRPPRVFISYSHDSDEHRGHVLELANRLRSEGVDAWLDRYEQAPPEGWPRWMQRQVEQADFILLVCTETYKRRFEGNEEPGKSRGVTWEGLLAAQLLYEAGMVNRKLLPVLFGNSSSEEDRVPFALRSYVRFRLPDEYETLYRLLTSQPDIVAPLLGKTQRFPVAEFLRPLGETATRSEGLPSPEQDSATVAVLSAKLATYWELKPREPIVEKLLNTLQETDQPVDIHTVDPVAPFNDWWSANVSAFSSDDERLTIYTSVRLPYYLEELRARLRVTERFATKFDVDNGAYVYEKTALSCAAIATIALDTLYAKHPRSLVMKTRLSGAWCSAAFNPSSALATRWRCIQEDCLSPKASNRVALLVRASSLHHYPVLLTFLDHYEQHLEEYEWDAYQREMLSLRAVSESRGIRGAFQRSKLSWARYAATELVVCTTELLSYLMVEGVSDAGKPSYHRAPIKPTRLVQFSR